LLNICNELFVNFFLKKEHRFVAPAGALACLWFYNFSCSLAALENNICFLQAQEKPLSTTGERQSTSGRDKTSFWSQPLAPAVRLPKIFSHRFS
jgi:hypothetical protein